LIIPGGITTSSAAAFVLTAVIGVVGPAGAAPAPPAAVVAVAAAGAVWPGAAGRGKVGKLGIAGRATGFVAAGWSRVVPTVAGFVVTVVVVVVAAPAAVPTAPVVVVTAGLVAAPAIFVATPVKFVTLGTRASVPAGPRSGTPVSGGAAGLVASERIGRVGTAIVPRFVFVVCAERLAATATVVSNVKVFIFAFGNWVR
jgi:hypothetical protein